MKRPRGPPTAITDTKEEVLRMMTRNEKKAQVESMAEYFMNTDDLEGKSMSIMVLNAYLEGKAAGKEEERKRLEQKQEATA